MRQSRGARPQGSRSAPALGPRCRVKSPGREELAIGAIASGGVIVINDDVVRGLGIAPETIQRVAEEEGRELQRREQAYRERRPAPDVAGKVVTSCLEGVGSSRGGRPDLAAQVLPRVHQPVLLIVGEKDPAVLELNRQAMQKLAGETELVIVPGASHLFEEPGALEHVAQLARDWFLEHLT